MAPNLGKSISLGKLKESGKKQKSNYPEKRYINLVQHDEQTVDLRRAIPTAIIIVIVLALFAKFGIYDFYARLADKQAELGAQTSQLSTLQTQLKNYNAVLEEYQGYEAMNLSSDGLAVNALDVLALVDQHIAPSANIASLSLQGDTLSLNLTDVTLDGVGQLASTLHEQELVENVSVSTAATRNSGNENVTAAMTIKLVSTSSESK